MQLGNDLFAAGVGRTQLIQDRGRLFFACRVSPGDSERQQANPGALQLDRQVQVIRGYIVDLYCAQLRLVVEIDGGVHRPLLRVGYDLERAERLHQSGIRYQLHLRPEDVSEATLLALLGPLLPLAREGEGAGG